jgi:hypothetical protein
LNLNELNVDELTVDDGSGQNAEVFLSENGTSKYSIRYDDMADQFQICQEYPSLKYALKVLSSSANVVIPYDLHVNGSLYGYTLPYGDRRNVQWDDGSGRFYYDNSSRRHKENIQPLEDDFSRLLRAQPMTYTRPDSPEFWEIGFIAEDFHDLGLNKLVDYDAEGRPDGINYEKICLYLKEIAESQQKDIEDLQRQNQALESRLENLEMLVESLFD